MINRRGWIYLRRSDDTGSGYSLANPPESRLLDAQTFTPAEIQRMIRLRPSDYYAADLHWKEAYKVDTDEEDRRFIFCLAKFMSELNGLERAKRAVLNTVRAAAYYELIKQHRPKKCPTERTLQTLVHKYDDDGFISVEKEGKADILLFTGWQKHCLLVATAVEQPAPESEYRAIPRAIPNYRITNQGAPLTGPSK